MRANTESQFFRWTPYKKVKKRNRYSVDSTSLHVESEDQRLMVINALVRAYQLCIVHICISIIIYNISTHVVQLSITDSST